MITQEMVIWFILVAFVSIALVAKTVSDIRRNKKSGLIGVITEEEMFYCPGRLPGVEDDGLLGI